MVRINLAPPERRSSRRIPSLSSIGRPSGDILRGSPEVVVGVVALAGLIAAVVVYQGERRTLADLEAAIVEAERDSTALHDRIEQVRNLERIEASLAARVEILKEVVEGRAFVVDLWETVARTLPEDTWIDRISREDLAEGMVRIDGGTFRNAAVTDFMRALESSDALESVTLVGVSRVEGGEEEASFQSFTVMAAYENFTPVDIAPADTTEGSQ